MSSTCSSSVFAVRRLCLGPADAADIETEIGVPPPPTVYVHPDETLYAACASLVRTHARRIPLIDKDEQTGKDTILSVLTQYRVLKFIAINVRSRPRSSSADLASAPTTARA